MPILIYHITHLGNLEGIIRAGGLAAKTLLQREQVDHVSIAYEHIQDRRARMRVACGPGGMLHDYVPFYFAPRSPMLYTIHRGNVPSFPEGQTPVLHLVADVDAVVAARLPYVFTDGHAVIAPRRSTLTASAGDRPNSLFIRHFRGSLCRRSV